ncbi:hypothetical protein DPMN_074523 [Dreissena polymorpha]|uniref:Uncharacterized protein n=1 Tax=Dreissena polymorpha TaxID=45954 RepID=A0A9D3YHV7_DREPO|nr:hypothetical protein DPMN_074523 [Dreissena polymorpha]
MKIIKLKVIAFLFMIIFYYFDRTEFFDNITCIDICKLSAIPLTYLYRCLLSELGTCARVNRVLVQWVGKAVCLLLLLYLFICSLDFLSSAFRILGGKTAGGVFTQSSLLQNPVAGLMVGILATVLVQSSSTSTSIVVTMVGSGILEVRPAIPIIMGANIGTSVTNTFVSMAQSGDRKEFRRAFAGATVHDMFNWLTVLVLLPLEWATGYLYMLTKAIVDAIHMKSYTGGNQELLKALTEPFTNLIVQVDKKVISKIAEGHSEFMNKSLIQKYCVFEDAEVVLRNASINGTESNYTEANATALDEVPIGKCASLFSQLELSDSVSGVILLVFSLALLCTCLVLMVKLLNSILKGSIAKVIKKTLNADFPGCFSWLTGYVAMLVGAVMTLLVQSSSVFTSALTPLVGIGMIKVERMYPLTLGSNIGTTGTGILAAMAASGDKLPIALQIAFCHLFFNLSGIVLFYPVPALRRLPIRCAKFLGSVTSKYRWFAMAYILMVFLLIPAAIFAISVAGFIPSVCVASVVIPCVLFVVILNILQSKCKSCLPKALQTWDFLPKCLRSLEPIDKVISSVLGLFKRSCPCCTKSCARKPQPTTLGQVVQKHTIAATIAKNIVKDKSIPLKVSPAPSVASSRLLLSRSSTEQSSFARSSV